LIIEKDGEDFWPMFDTTTTNDWRENQEAKKFEEDQATALKHKNFWNGAATTIGSFIKSAITEESAWLRE